MSLALAQGLAWLARSNSGGNATPVEDSPAMQPASQKKRPETETVGVF
jgi:hypothetical protein